MHIRKYLSIFLIGLVFAIAGCSPDSTSGISEEDRLPDTDNDGIVDKNDPDIDGDGILNKDDTDDDGDGTPDATDPTPNGPGGEAPTPDLTCTSANIKPPKHGITGVQNTASWKLLPEGCGVTVNRTVVVTATYDGVTTESDSASLGDLTTNITLPHKCSWEDWEGNPEVPITYDFSEIAVALGDTSGDYEQIVDAEVSSDICQPVINVDNLRSRDFPYPILESTVNTDGTVTASSSKGKAALYKPASEVEGVEISELPEPKWSATPKGYMNIYTTGVGCALDQVDIEPADTAGSYITKPKLQPARSAWKHYKTWELLQKAPEVEKCKVAKAPIQFVPGNFIVNWGEGIIFTINSYNVPSTPN